jgi:hypothetical protein
MTLVTMLARIEHLALLMARAEFEPTASHASLNSFTRPTESVAGALRLADVPGDFSVRKIMHRRRQHHHAAARELADRRHELG